MPGAHPQISTIAHEAFLYGQVRVCALVIATGLPHGKTDLGVLVEFPHRVPRRLPPSVGAGWATDPASGEVVSDERMASVVLHPARVVKQWDEYELGVAVMRHEHEQRKALRN